MNKLQKYVITSFLLLGCFLAFPSFVHAENRLDTLLSDKQQALPQEALPAASLIIEASNGQILWDENSEILIDPGFLTNLMTLYLMYEAIEKGRITWEDTITANEQHQTLAQIPGLPSNNLMQGVTYSVKDLVELISFTQSVGASFLLADLISQNPQNFVAQMNQTAEKFGLTQTIFTNPSGLSFENSQGYETWIPITLSQNNQSTPRDLALLTYQLIQQYPEILEITQQEAITIHAGTLTEETFYTKNPFLFGQAQAIKGTSGLLIDDSKPTQMSGIFTTKQDGLLLITLMIDVNQAFVTQQGLNSFHLIGKSLIGTTFEQYEYRQLLAPGSHEINQKIVTTDQALKGVVKKGNEPTFDLTDETLVLTNALPLLSETLKPISIPYTLEISALEERIEENAFVRFLMNFVEVTKLTIFAIGTTLIGFLIFLMHFFIPKKELEEEETIFFDFETNEAIEPDEVESEAIIVSRAELHTNDALPFWQTLPYRQIALYGGLGIASIGLLILIIQSLL